MGNSPPLVVLEIEADDVQRASAFYTSVFGWLFHSVDGQPQSVEAELTADRDTHIRVQPRKSDVVGESWRSVQDVANHNRWPQLCVSDLGQVLAKISHQGIVYVGGPSGESEPGRRIFMRDTEGNVFTVTEPIHNG